MTLIRIQQIFSLLVFSLTTYFSYAQSNDWNEIEGDYFYFSVPNHLGFKEIKLWDPSIDSTDFRLHIKSWTHGDLVFNDFSIEFVIVDSDMKNAEIVVIDRDTIRNPPPPSCTDFPLTILEKYSITQQINGQNMRLVSSKNLRGHDTYWVDLCVDMKHKFKTYQIKPDQIEDVKKTLKSVKIKQLSTKPKTN